MYVANISFTGPCIEGRPSIKLIVIVEPDRTCRRGNIKNLPVNTRQNLLDGDFFLTVGARDNYQGLIPLALAIRPLYVG